jgi:hypothetical protein
MEHQRVAGVDAAGGLGRAGVFLLTGTCAAAAYRAAAAGDVAVVAFVIVSYGALLLLPRFLRADELAPPEAAVGREPLRRRVWALCMLLSVMFACKFSRVKQWPVAVGVWAAAAATSAGGFVLLFRQQRRLRELEQGGSGRDAKIKAAVWALITTLLITALFSGYPSEVAPLVVVGALVFLCLGEFERAWIGLGGQYAGLVKMAFGVAACNFALAQHHSRGDAGSMALVFFAYVAFVTHTWFFLRRFDGRARGAGQ